MIKSGKEIIILAPREALIRAKELKRQKKFREALDILEANNAQFEISLTKIEAKIPKSFRSRALSIDRRRRY